MRKSFQVIAVEHYLAFDFLHIDHFYHYNSLYLILIVYMVHS